MKLKSFSLIEIIIWCGMIMILFWLLLSPVLNLIDQTYLIQEAQTVTQDIDFVRSLSRLQSEKLKMEWFGSQNRYRFEISQGGMGKIGQYIERNFNSKVGFPYYFSTNSVSYVDENGTAKTGSINFGSTSSDSYGTLVFDSTGTPSQGGHIVLMIRNTKRALAIIVKPVTGRTRIGKVHFIHP
jgi:type II secretory pathway pseudopilin PulG